MGVLGEQVRGVLAAGDDSNRLTGMVSALEEACILLADAIDSLRGEPPVDEVHREVEE